MEGHNCQLCTKSFLNGKALGAHMKAHFGFLPIPPKQQHQQTELGDHIESTQSLSSSSSDSEDETQTTEEQKGLIYGLRENPKKSFKLVDSEFLDAEWVVIDRECRTESTRNPTRKRSKMTGNTGVAAEPETEVNNQPEWRKPKLKKLSSLDSVAELEAASSISCTICPEDEDGALSLMMLSRDTWTTSGNPLKPLSLTRERFQALGGDRTSHKKVKNRSELLDHDGESPEERTPRKDIGRKNVVEKGHKCPFCNRVFEKGQALGGHKRTHARG